jgi:hypothetical protein
MLNIINVCMHACMHACMSRINNSKSFSKMAYNGTVYRSSEALSVEKVPSGPQQNHQ